MEENLTVISRSARTTKVVLVHGAWVDASSWNGVIEHLQAEGLTVFAVPNPLRGPSSDTAYLAGILKTISGPIILVGHSYGGAVVTNAGTGNPSVEALIYMDAFVPDQGESLLQLATTPPPSGQEGSCLAGNPATKFNTVPLSGDLDLYIQPDLFSSCFANDLPAKQSAVLAVSQRPVTQRIIEEPSGTPAWKTIPSFYLIGTLDKVIPPYAQLFMAQRAKSQISYVKASHLSIISNPHAAADLIIQVLESAMTTPPFLSAHDRATPREARK
jgi:pimeloyl-ACP methyl ester carboxylesterase